MTPAINVNGFVPAPPTPVYTAEQVCIVFNGSNAQIDAYNRFIQRYGSNTKR